VSSGDPISYWVESAPRAPRATLQGERRADVCVIGGGIVGVMTASLLKEEGRSVALVEAHEVARGTTGYTTAKVTSSHSLIYAKLERSFGVEGARIYGEANEAGKELIAELTRRYGIDCDFEREDNFVYTEEENGVAKLEAEVAAAVRAGLPASFVTESPLPFPIKGAMRFENQAQFHPRRFVAGLADTVAGNGAETFEGSRVTKVESDGRHYVVRTERGSVIADDVVLATHLPFLDRGLFFTKAHPYRSYALATHYDDPPSGMHISTGSSTRTIRWIRDGDRKLLLVGGEGHRAGAIVDTNEPFERLVTYGRDRFGIDDFTYRWATHDYVSVDHVPYVGRVTRGSDGLFTATGFGKWGLTNGAAAAMMLRDLILGKSNPWQSLFDSKRVKPLASATSFLKENGEVAIHFIADRVDRSAPRCTHLGCVLKKNLAENTWDCPCHGSRFDREGKVIEGPATSDLKVQPPAQ